MKRLIPLWCVALLLFLPLLGTPGNVGLLAADNHGHTVQNEHGDQPAHAAAAHQDQHSQAGGHGSMHDADEHAPLGQRLPLWSVIPFAGILLSIAIIPLVKPEFYHHNFGKVALFWALLFAIPFWVAYGTHTALHAILHIYVVDYIPFIILLFGLFTVAGGIAVKGKLAGSPVVNTGILLIGTLLASWIGTTGAAMLLIRPLLKSNEKRRYRVHSVVFFIFLVANIGGSLTPIGDPPLFLGFLHGVSFFWTLRCFVPMIVNVVILLAVYFILDTILMKKEQLAPETGEKDPLRLEGGLNFLMLLGIVAAVIFSGSFNHHPFFYNDAAHAVKGIPLMGGEHPLVLPYINLARDLFILLMAWLSLKLTAKATREANEFNWFPIQEVAYVFAGIFMTIIPALEILRAGTNGALGFIVEKVSGPASYFWVTGALSSFLDNAPTYLTFFNTALGQQFPGMTEAQAVPELMSGVTTLLAISCGAVFMGANTYIGNAPNFMVKSIAEQRGVKMPSFFGYMLWSVGILVPIFILDTLLFF